jgi:acylphosphatase
MTSEGIQSIFRLTAHISGEVQGVGYRAYARRRAQMLGLRGYARNLADGTVEVVVEGPRDALEHLFVVLRRGPASAEVTDAQASWSEPTGEFSTFSIR